MAEQERKREKFLFRPEAHNYTEEIIDGELRVTSAPGPESEPEPAPIPGEYPCPCCGYLTLPVPKEDAIAYICPVCFWENDVFDPGEDDPSDENGGMTLRQGRENFKRYGAARPDLVRHTRPPRSVEIPPGLSASTNNSPGNRG